MRFRLTPQLVRSALWLAAICVIAGCASRVTQPLPSLSSSYVNAATSTVRIVEYSADAVARLTY